MPEASTFSQTLEHWAHLGLVWIGFGTLAGLLAKAIMPGRDPGGSIATLLMGIGGAVIGLGVLTLAWRDHQVTPVSPIGFIVATVGAFVLLFFYRLLGGYWFVEGEHTEGGWHIRRRRRRRTQVHYDD